MMPFINDNPHTLPREFRDYWPLIRQCPLSPARKGKIAFLTVNESFVRQGETQRRPGLHVDRHPLHAWGGETGGGGIFLANSLDHTCRLWCTRVPLEQVGDMGDCQHLRESLCRDQIPSLTMRARQLWWMTDDCPHEALPQTEDAFRIFFRLITGPVSLFYWDHNTHNFLVDLPNDIKIVKGNKFESFESSLRA